MTPTALAEARPKAAQAPPKREVEALAKRVLIVGLDGATLDVMGPLMDDGYMPNLRRICSQGTSGILNSTMPPITPAAWTTFMTGKGPAKKVVLFNSHSFSLHPLR